MLKKLFANTLAKKTTIFAAVFAITCILMGNKLSTMSGEMEMLKVAVSALQVGQAATTAQVWVDTNTPSTQTMAVSGEYPAVTAEPLLAQEQKPKILANIPAAEGFVYCQAIPLSYDLQKYTYNECVEKDLDYELVLAVMWRESRFQVDAVNLNTNGTQDSGIMQINDVNKGWLQDKLGIVDLMDPLQNIDAGTTMLSGFTNKYGIHDGLMAYQYGEVGMQRKFEQGVTTNDKITLVMDKRDDFRYLIQDA